MSQYELNLRDYLRILFKRKVLIISTCLFSVFLSFFYTTHEIPTYEAKASVKIDQRKTIAGLLTEEILYSPGDVMSTAARLITGFPVLKNAALHLKLIDENTPPEKIKEAAGEIAGSITTSPVPSTNVIEITATSEDPKKAMDYANAVAEAYIEENLLEKNKETTTVRKFIENQLTSLDKRSKEVEERLRILRTEVKDIQISPAIQGKLTELEVQLVSLMQKYTDKHPAVVKIRGQINELESQFSEFSKQELEYAGLLREVEVNKKLYEMLKEKLEEARISEAQKVNDVSMLNPAGLPDQAMGTTSESGYLIGGLLGLILGITFAFLREGLDTSIGTMEDVENFIKLPVLGVIPSVPTTFKETKNLFIKLKRRLLHEQKSETEEINTRLIVHHEPGSSVAEACRNIRTNLKIGPSRKTFLITSAGPREGKTTVLVNLGLTVAQTGARTLLVSTDLRRPTVDKTFGIDRTPGISEIITGKVALKDAIRSVSDIMLGSMSLEDIMQFPRIENIWILTSGHIPTNPAELLESPEMGNLMKEVRNKFDVVFYDAPPVLPVTDAVLLASKVDGVILCYEVGRTSRDALARAKIQLESAGANILGLILNHTAPQAAFIYPYYYNYKYRYYEKENKHDKTMKNTEDEEKPA